MPEQFVSGELPILALRGLVVYPEQTMHFDVGRMKSVLALEAAMKKDQLIMLIPQKDILKDDPSITDLYSVGTVVYVKQILKSQGENIRVLVEGICRARVDNLIQSAPYFSGEISAVEDSIWEDNLRTEALRRESYGLFSSYLEYVEKPSQGVMLRILSSTDCSLIADTIAQHSSMDYKDKAKLLLQLNPVRRLESVITILRKIGRAHV